MNKIKFYINIIDIIVCFIRIYLYFCIINEDDMNEVKKRLPLQCPSCDAPLKVGRLFCEECNILNCLYWRACRRKSSNLFLIL